MNDPEILKLKKIISNMTRYLSKQVNFQHTGSEQYLQEPIQFNETIDNSNGYLEIGDNGAIVIGKGVHHVNIKSSMRLTHSTNNHATAWIYIRKNGNNVAGLSEDSDYVNTSNALTTFKDYLEVEEGDIIQTYFACDYESGSIYGQNYPITQMSVQVAD